MMLFRYLKRPFIMPEILFGAFLLVFTVLFGPVFGPFARLLGFGAIGLFAVEILYRGRILDFIETVRPAWPYLMFYIVLPILVLPLFPYFPRVWNNFTGFAAFLAIFYIMRKYHKMEFVAMSYIGIIYGIALLFLVMPGLVGMDTSVDRLRLNASALGKDERGLNASNISLLTGLACFIAAKRIAIHPLGKRQFLRLKSLSWYYAGGILVGAYLIIGYSGSRQGLVWFVFLGIFMLAVFFKKNLFIGIVFSGFGGLIGLAGSLFVFRNTLVVQRILILFDQRQLALEGEKSFFTRGEMYKRAYEMWLDSPLWGNGNEAYRAFSGFNTYSHSNFSEIFVNYGILGAMFYYIPIMFLIWVSSLRLISGNMFGRAHYMWILIACVAILASNLFIPSYYQKCMVFFLAYLFATYYNIKEAEQRQMTRGGRGPRRFA